MSQRSIANRLKRAFDLAINPYSQSGRRMRSRGSASSQYSHAHTGVGKVRVNYKKAPKIEPVPEGEYKYFDQTFSNVEIAADSNSTVAHLCDIDEGTSSITRVGKKIRPISFQALMNLVPVTQLSVFGQWIDISLVCDKQGNRTPNLTDIWTENYRSLREVDSTDYTILKTWHVYFPRSDANTIQGEKAIKLFYKFPKETVIRYDDVTGDAANVSANNLWMCWQTSNLSTTLAGNDGILARMEMRLRFADV